MTPKNEQQKALLEELLLDYAIWFETNYPSLVADCKSLFEESVPQLEEFEFATLSEAVRAVYGETPEN